MLPTEGLQQIRTRIAPLRSALIEHSVYQSIQTLPALQIFMQHHVFAVWDFMSLLKGLQNQLTCVELPWTPVASRQGARMINEIVLGEESDEDGQGGYASHFELYRRAMVQCGASTRPIDGLLESINSGMAIQPALARCEISESVRSFVHHTFQVLETGDLPAIAAVFTFGREDLLPDLFECIVNELNERSQGELSDFLFYLQRHIELDGDEHGPLAQSLIIELCGTDAGRWNVVTSAAEAALRARLELWNGIQEAIANQVG